MRLPWWLVTPLAVGLPLMTWMQGRSPTANAAVSETPAWLFSVGILVAISLACATQEPWLGTFAAYMAIRSVWTMTPWAFEGAQTIVFGVVAILAVKQTPRPWRPRICLAISSVALFQAGYAALQNIAYSGTPATVHWEWGSWTMAFLGNPNHLGAYLAISTGLAPGWWIPFLVGGILLSRSRLALLAVSGVLLIRFRRSWRMTLPAIAGLVLLLAFIRGGLSVHLDERWLIQRVTLQAVGMAPVFGFGPGAWASIGPVLQSSPSIAHRFTEVFGEAHNDALQLLFEGGLVAVFLVGGCVWSHRRIWRSPYGGSLAALALETVGSFPFHVPTLSALAFLLLGLALAEEDETPLRHP